MTTQNSVRTSAAGIKHKPFNLPEALAGKPVIRLADGKPVTGISHHPEADVSYRVVGLVHGEDCPEVWKEDGSKYFETKPSLGLAVEEKTGYVPTKPSVAVAGRTYVPGGYIYETHAAAEAASPGYNIAEIKYHA